jgi:hypothetical protein
MLMQRSSAGQEEAFLHAEACELAILSKEYVGCAAAGRKPKSVLHTLSVELSVLIGIDDSERLDRLVAEATRLLSREGRQDAITALQATSSRVRDVASSQSLHRHGAHSEYRSRATPGFASLWVEAVTT